MCVCVERIASLTEEIARKKAKLEQLRDGGRSVTKEERDAVYKKHAGIFKEWKKRRRMVQFAFRLRVDRGAEIRL